VESPEFAAAEMQVIGNTARILTTLRSLDNQPHMKLAYFRSLDQWKLIEKHGGDERAAMAEFERVLAEALALVPAAQVAKAEARARKEEKRKRKAETVRYTNGLRQRWF